MMMTRAMKIVSSPWVLPISRPVVVDGSVVVADGRIVDIGQRREILAKYPGTEERCYPGLLLPGLINAHIHLELSHLRDIPAPLPHHTFTDWIAGLLAKRSTDHTSREERLDAVSALLRDQHASGVVLVADTGNECFAELDKSAEDWPEILRMLEYLGPDRQGDEAARRAIEDLEGSVAVTGHAPYSTRPELLQYIKERCWRLQQIFSIHTAEHSAELQFLHSRTGIFRDFLEKRNRWDGSFGHTKEGCSGTIDYYNRLGLLDDWTLMVHCVHVSAAELQLAARRGAHICLCPGSNRFLKVGTAPVTLMVKAGILPALGTDSYASNPAIDLWREMQLLAGDHPDLPPERILAMATLGGAQALHVEQDFGSIEPGRKGRFLHISSPTLLQCRTATALMQALVTGGRPAEISWV